MHYSMKQLTLFAALAMCLQSFAFAGAWTPEEGTGYHKFAANSLQTGRSFGEAEPGFEEFVDRNVTYYFEYGLRDDLAFIASIPFKDLSRRDNGIRTDNSGIGDVELALRYNLATEPFVLSAQLLLKAPYFYDRDDSLQLGNGQEDFEFRLQLGKSLGNAGYYNVEAGYRFRVDAPADEYRYLLEYGGDVSERVYLRAKLDGLAAAGSSSTAPARFGNPTLPLEFDLGKLEATAGLRFGSNWAWEFTATNYIYGDNTLRGVNYQLALIYSN